MGSEMCIRDRTSALNETEVEHLFAVIEDLKANGVGIVYITHKMDEVCLLYTSDAADERSSVDLGGRRIIKKKKQEERARWASYAGQHSRGHRRRGMHT